MLASMSCRSSSRLLALAASPLGRAALSFGRALPGASCAM